jgi:hypothetical protein
MISRLINKSYSRFILDPRLRRLYKYYQYGRLKDNNYKYLRKEPETL